MRIALRIEELVVAVPDDGGRLSLSARVKPGEIVAIQVEPAAGTALARTVAGLAEPLSGRVYVGDSDVTGEPPAGRKIGYVPAGGGLLPHLTVDDNIHYGLRRRDDVLELSREWAETVTLQLELRPTLGLRPHQLSDAQRLRVALARAAVCRPEVLVVDAPNGEISIRDLVTRASLPSVPQMAVLVCTVTAGADRVITP